MRAITAQIKEAFENQKPRKIGNTATDGQTVWLHGNAIVRRDSDGTVLATLAGWNTPTTRERVNGITGLGFHQLNWGACIDSVPVSETEWFPVTLNN